MLDACYIFVGEESTPFRGLFQMRNIFQSFLLFFLAAGLTHAGIPDSLKLRQLIDSAEAATDRAQFDLADQLFREARALNPDEADAELKFDFYHYSALNDFRAGKLRDAEQKASIAHAIASAEGQEGWLLPSSSSLANITAVQGRPRESLYHNRRTLSYLGPEDSTIYYSVLNNMSHAYKGLGKTDSALYVLVAAKNFYSRIGQVYPQAILEGNIAEIYREDFEDFELARKHYLRAIALLEIEGSPNDFARNYHNYGILLGAEGVTDSALYYLSLSVDIRRQIGDLGGRAGSYVEQGRIYLEQEDYASAVERFAEALRISEKYGIAIGIYHSSRMLGRAHEELGNYRVALSNYKRAAEQAEIGDWRDKQIEIYDEIYALHKAYGYFEEALLMLEELSAAKEKYDKKEAEYGLAEIRAKYESEITANQNKALLLEKEVNQRKLEAQRWGLVALSLIILVFLLAGFFLYNAVRQRNRALKKLAAANDRLESQLEKIRAQEKRLVEANEFKNRVISVIGHDLRSPLANIMAILEIISSSENASNAETRSMFARLREETDANLKSLQNILEWSRLEEQSLMPDRTLFDITEHLDYARQLHGKAIAQKGLTLAVEGDNKFIADKNQFRSVLSNLLGNAVKYSPEGGEIKIRTLTDANGSLLRITDSGEGVPDEVKQALTSRRRITSKPGTRGERGTGVGLRLVHDFALAHGGSFRLLPNPSGGTIAEVYFPRKQPVPSTSVQTENSLV